MPANNTNSFDYGDGFETREDGSVSLKIAADAPDVAEETPPEVVETPAETPEETPEEPKPADKEPEEPNFDELGAAIEATLAPEETPAVPAEPGLPKKRDYSQFPAEVAAVARNMSNDAFAKFSEIYKERAELQRKYEEAQAAVANNGGAMLPTAADGYKYHPTFQNLATEHSQAGQFEQHWASQLAALRRGDEQIINLQLDKQGQMVRTPIPVSDEVRADLESQVLDQLLGAKAAKTEIQRKVGEFKDSYTAQVQKNAELINGFRQKFLPSGAIDKTIVGRVLNVFPEALRNDPRHQVIAELVAAMHTMHMHVQRMKQAQKGKAAVDAAVASQGIQPSSAGKENSLFDMKTGLDDLRKLAAGTY